MVSGLSVLLFSFSYSQYINIKCPSVLNKCGKLRCVALSAFGSLMWFKGRTKITAHSDDVIVLKMTLLYREGNQAVSSGMRGRGLGCNTWRASNPIFLRNRMRRSSKVISIFEIRKANRPEQNIFIFYLLFPVKLGCSYKHTWVIDTQDLPILNPWKYFS